MSVFRSFLRGWYLYKHQMWYLLQVAEFVLYYAPAFNSLKDTDRNLADCQQL